MKLSCRGSMLVMAMWTLMILGIFSLSLGLGVRQKATLLNRLTMLDALYPIAYSGVEDARSLVRSDRIVDVDTLNDPWALGAAGESSLVGGHFEFVTNGVNTIEDEERKININKTSVEILVRLLKRVTGLAESDAESLGYNLIDWMDSDSAFGHPQYGAEKSYYEGLDKPYPCKDAPYELMDELLLVKDMTPEIFEKIRPFATVYGTGQVNLNTARPEVLSALGFSETGVQLIQRCRAGADGKEGTADDNAFINAGQVPSAVEAQTGTKLDQSQTVLLEGLIAASRVGVNSTVFSVTSRGITAKNGTSVDVEAVIDRQGRIRYQRSKEIAWPVRT